MQPIKTLHQWLLQNTNEQHYLFLYKDLRAICSELSDTAFKTLLSRAVSSAILVRVCRGIYLYPQTTPTDGLLLFRVAALLRFDKFNYISLETVLSDVGIISQVPINWITIMSSGRSSIITCSTFGTIEFVHTKQEPNELIEQLHYDQACGLWRANPTLALRDMRMARRNLDLIDWDLANELI